MAGKEKGHLKLPREAFNLAVLPVSAGCFTALGALASSFFLPLPLFPLG
jgi:hypothetical protein